MELGVQDPDRPWTQVYFKMDRSDVQVRNKAILKWWAWAIDVTAVGEFKWERSYIVPIGAISAT